MLKSRQNLAFVILLALCASLLAQTAPPPDLDSYVANSMKTFDVPGMAVAIVKDGKDRTRAECVEINLFRSGRDGRGAGCTVADRRRA